ncbi:hypothetical protein LX32DRAFT_633649 [Colletotrichum zoysiae]|uniref:Uncharacterized protein n=1 Tax=Colletotrichum zoysiae TaxID=1216348 RepID=A0AAD9HW54_9PEZI|nr:hypothetical protein LX32DRAFT_633649 [Colletotrichum zoysiae]
MHAPTVLFALFSLLPGLVAAGFCCNGGADDPKNFCKNQNLNAFCCSTRDADSGIGCDGD